MRRFAKISQEEHELNTFGRHLLVEFFGCSETILNDIQSIEDVMRKAVKASGATEVGCVFHKFNPVGASGVIVLSESHISIHTWPEEGFAAVDFYTCGDCDPHRGLDILLEGLDGSHYELMYVERGLEGQDKSMQVRNHAVSPTRFRPRLVENAS
ncbi:adenosylmethionine decarboxylase [Microvenator marinus]|uniref:S-adenosylmethionine decarboxylase proenzyme n=1 Tax=Microvenator marinus TaxID=2600177 RepID=A0A5B8XTY7_9DELT|nr:adenosylmethionine decarboxylase [Microvenator marinus]